MFDEKKVLKTLMECGAIYGDIFTEERRYCHVEFESGKVEKLDKGEDGGVGLRLIDPWRTFYASTTSFDEVHLIDVARELSKYSRQGGNAGKGLDRTISASYPFRIDIDPEGVSVEDKLSMVKNLERMIKKMERRIKQVRVVYRDTCQKVTMHNTQEGTIQDTRMQVVLNVLVVGQEGTQIQTAYDSIGGFYGFEYFSPQIIEEMAVKTVRRLTGLLGAREAPMGTKTVVLAAEAGGTMIHEAVGHGLEADLAMEGLSCYKDMIGETVASSLISVVDDATVPHMRGTYAFDDEGVPAERTLLIEKGVLKGYLFDRFHALRYGKRSTGNGRRESFRFRPIPRMSNTMILPGSDDPSGIVASVDDGVYVVRMGGGQVDTVRGDFVFEISEGYLIEKGTIGPMIRNATMMGNGLKVLREIDMVGTDTGFGIGTCGKEGQGVPVSDAQPTLRIPEIVVGGREQ